MKKITLLIVALLSLYACENDKSKAKKVKPAELEEIKQDNKALEQLVGAEFSAELYCEDCDMIHFKVAFDKDKYYLKYAYQGVKRDGHFEEGKYKIEDGILSLESVESDYTWKMKIKEDTLHLLNFENKELDPTFVEKYQLNRLN